MTHSIYRIVIFVTCLLLPTLLFAAVSQGTGFGQAADSLMSPVTLASEFVSSASIAIGACFIFAALVKYSQHRVNPLAVPISTVVILVILGALLLLLPLTYKLVSGGVH